MDFMASLPDWAIPLGIFAARICDVSLGTLRIILVARGQRTTATFVGFLEILIWLAAISQVLQNITEWQNFFAYAAGFAVGTYVGMTIERALAIGHYMVRIIIPEEAEDLVMYLISADYKITYFGAEGALGPKKIIYTQVPRKGVKHLIELVRNYAPKAFYTVEDVQIAKDPVRPRPLMPRFDFSRLANLFRVRK